MIHLCISKDISTLSGHTDTIRCVKAVASNRAVSSSRDSTIRVWNVVNGECQAILEGHTGTVRTLAFNSNILVSASYDSTARIWSLENQECLHVLSGHKGQLYSVVCDEKKIVTADIGGEVRIWEIMSGYVDVCFEAASVSIFYTIYGYGCLHFIDLAWRSCQSLQMR